MNINCKGNLINLSSPKVMGILNITPDSFFDGGKNNSINSALKKTEKMLEQGADIIDIGGQSTRPNSEFLQADDELKRVLPIIEKILIEFPETIISVDTFWSKVAKKTVEYGAAIINDISAGNIDDKMFTTIAQLNVPYILMHMIGTPQNMQKNPVYDNILEEVNLFFAEKLNQLHNLGVNDVILDAGFGFGKTVEQNYELLKNQRHIGFGKYPILTGISRKSMIFKVLKNSPEEALNGTTALNMLSLIQNAKILRVHDVKEATECVKIFKAYEGLGD